MDFGDSFDISEDDVDAEICDNPEAIDIADCIPAEAEVDKLSDLEDLGNIDSLEITSDVSPVDEPISDFELWKHEMDDLGAELTDDTLDALWEEPDNRSYQQTELVDIALHPDYEDQRSILVDAETGKAVQDESGDFVDCSRNTKGAQRPDGMLVDENGVHLREVKDYHNVNNLKQNINHQPEDRRGAFGDDVDLTYVVAPNFTLEDAEELQDYVENKLGIDLEWQLK